MMKRYQSWGRYPKVEPSAVKPLFWRNELPDLAEFDAPVLPFAYGRSYGDSCLTEGVLLDVSFLNRFMAFDEKAGILRCEAGVSFADILEVTVPRGWFLPVVPGTKHVSVGGAIANDIHGKNHHVAGSFGGHVRSFELVRSTGDHLICSPTENSELFHATIGGLGLTGVILWAEFHLKRVATPFIAMERIPFNTLEDFFKISKTSDREFEHTVAWIDCLARDSKSGRGIFIRGNHADPQAGTNGAQNSGRPKHPLRIGLDFPSFVLSPPGVKLFNHFYFQLQSRGASRKVVPYEPFFFPLDRIEEWNRIYGKRGFLQYQCVVPPGNEYDSITEILARIGSSGAGSFLAVLKKFGEKPSPGLLAFTRPGTTLALDFGYRGERTLHLLQQLDKIVVAAGGAVYPAKDARMDPETFQAYFPKWRQFSDYIDPKFRSRFWQRVTGTGDADASK